MRVLSVNVGRAAVLSWRRETLRSAIGKQPVAGGVRAGPLGLAGDEQADLSVHGGPDKAVYLYPHEHYAFWRSELPGSELPLGVFGENLTTSGLVDAEIHIGDRLRIGSAELAVTQPRMPCSKLAARFGRADIVKRFQHSGRTGFYLRVLRAGDLRAGDSIELLGRAADSIAIAEIVRLHLRRDLSAAELGRLAALPGLSQAWRSDFEARLQRAAGGETQLGT